MDTLISNWWNAGKNLHLTSKNNHFTSLLCHNIIFRQEIFSLWENFDTQTLSHTHKEKFSLQRFVRKIFPYNEKFSLQGKKFCRRCLIPLSPWIDLFVRASTSKRMGKPHISLTMTTIFGVMRLPLNFSLIIKCQRIVSWCPHMRLDFVI